MAQPKISIFTPTNNSEYLRDVYNSIKDQGFYEWVIVYNNGAKLVPFNDPRIKVRNLSKPMEFIGEVKSFAAQHCTGDVLLELDHDDLLLPGALDAVRAAFEDPEVGFVYSDTVECTEDFKPRPKWSEDFGWQYSEMEFRGTKLPYPISFEPTPLAVSRIWYAPNHLRSFRRTVYDEVGGYNKEMRVLDDQDLMSRMYQVTKFHRIPQPLYLYRVHGKNAWLKHNQEIQDNVGRLYFKYIVPMMMKWCSDNRLDVIELGGGFNPTPGHKTVDLKAADVIHDLNTPWPFEDSSVGMIRSTDTFEHLADPIFVMKEVSRVLAPGGMLFCQVPSTDGRGAFQDPTHKSFWNQNSFLYYTNKNWAQYIESPVRFQAVSLYTTPKNQQEVCWVIAHLVNLKDGYTPPGKIEI